MKIKGVFFIIALLGMLAGCFDKELTDAERALVENLRGELKITQEKIVSAQSKDSQLSGGLVKSLISARIEILETNKALLEQRINAIEIGSPVKVVTEISQVDSELASALELEINQERLKLEIEQAEAANYGGLVGAMKAAAVATKEQTLAMLEQRFLVAKYGLNPVMHSVGNAGSTTQTESIVQSDEPNVPAASGPFGLEIGLSKEMLEQMVSQPLALNDEVQSLYTLSKPPKPNQAFEQYGLVISPKVGLCQIRAVGKTLSSNSFGHQLKEEFMKMQASLTSVYGQPELLDSLMPGSIWDDSGDWMMALYKNERSLIAEWSNKNNLPIKNNLQNITMVARAQSRGEGYILLQYSFTNYDVCRSEQEARAAGSL